MAKVEIPDFPSNSNISKQKEATKTLSEAAVSSNENRKNPGGKNTHKVVKKKKKSVMQKINDNLVAEDGLSVGQYLLWDVFLPALKDTIVSLVTNGVEMLFYGNENTKTSFNSRGDRISYQQYYKSNDNNRKNSSYSSKYSYNDYIFDTRQDAVEVLSMLTDLIDIYGQASVADYLDLLDESGTYMDRRYGWFDVSDAIIKQRSRFEYVLWLPRAVPLTDH